MTGSSPGAQIPSHLWEEYETQRALFEAQTPLVQRFLEAQSRSIVDALIQHQPQIRFMLPEKVVVEVTGQPATVPAAFREQLAGGLLNRLAGSDLRDVLRQRLAELEQASQRTVAVGAGLVRYAAATHMVQGMLPSGRSVAYAAAPGEEISSIPLGDADEAASGLTAATDVIVEEDVRERDVEHEALVVPYVPAARRFYLPQWVAFDDEGHLLVNSLNEAEAHVASMQRFLSLLHMAVSLAPYIVADEDYLRKRYGMLGQLVNQARALARFQTHEIIQTIQHRAAAHDLNRGLSLSLPYFDDQDLILKTHSFQVIPAGRIMFVPAFVVRAAREEQAKVGQDTRLSPSTRNHLLAELKTLEQAFLTHSRPS